MSTERSLAASLRSISKDRGSAEGPRRLRRGFRTMKRPSTTRRRPAVHITLGRAARLHRLVMFLAAGPQSRESVLSELGIGLRTFYRGLELLKRCGVKVQQREKAYRLLATAEQAEGRLPFPDPQLSFAEMAELARCPGE